MSYRVSDDVPESISATGEDPRVFFCVPVRSIKRKERRQQNGMNANGLRENAKKQPAFLVYSSKTGLF